MYEPYERVSSNVRRKPLYPDPHDKEDVAAPGATDKSQSAFRKTRRTDQRYLLSCSDMAFQLRDVHFGYLLKSKLLLALPHQAFLIFALDTPSSHASAVLQLRPKNTGILLLSQDSPLWLSARPVSPFSLKSARLKTVSTYFIRMDTLFIT